MTESTLAGPVGTQSPSPSASPPGGVVVPLRSDPPWLGLGVLAVTLGCVALFALYFRLLPAPRPSPTLALVPGFAVGTFASALFAWWSRRRSGTMQLEARADRIVLHEPARRAEVLDRAVSFGAALVTDASGRGRRILLLSQHGEPTMLLDTRDAEPPGGAWAARTVRVDLRGVAISPATAHVLTVRSTDSMDGLLGALEVDLGPESPLLMYPLPSGEVMLVTRDEIRLGRRVLPVGSGTTARRLTVSTPGGDVAALSLVAGDNTLLLACLDPTDLAETRGTSEAPDGYLPALVFALVASLFGLDGSTETAAPPSYRP